MKIFKLSDKFIEDHLPDLLCSYSETDGSILSTNSFLPQTFTVEEKRQGKELLLFSDISYCDWVRNMVKSQLDAAGIPESDKEELIRGIVENIETLLNYNENGVKIAKGIFNQEFIDIIRVVTSYTIYGNVTDLIETAVEFNCLADRILPNVMQELKEVRSLRDIFLLSVASGMSGLDLKGAPAAASAYANLGIAMKPYLTMDTELAASDYLCKLKEIASRSEKTVFDWEDFLSDISAGRKLVWMTDDYIESHFDLLFISKLLEQYDNLDIEIIPKNGTYGNDLSFNQLTELINTVFSDLLTPYLQNKRLTINQYGPKMGAANIRKLSCQCVKSLKSADLVMIKGCRIHEMLQGGLNINSYSAFIVSRTLSEVTTGLNSYNLPIVFCHLRPKEYAFWGMDITQAQIKILHNERSVVMCTSTMADHYRRKELTSPEDIIAEFEQLRMLLKTYSSDPTPIYQEMEMLSDKLCDITKTTYDNLCMKYQTLRRDVLHEMDQRAWDNLEGYIKRYVQKSPNDINMLDVATGSGRDIMYAHSRGYNIIGVDNSDGFIGILKRLQDAQMIPADSFRKCDMRKLCFEDNSFDVVRHNASILHMPIIAKGYTADKVISEAYRVLRPNGLLYVFVKQGNSLQFVDTGEGLGGRIFQFFEHNMINELLQRNGFTIIYTADELEIRPAGNIKWIAVIAQKRENDDLNN